jgi:hypothetical protein
MKNLYTYLFSLSTCLAFAQGQHGMHFNGNANFATAQNVSASLVNQPGITMTGWIAPANTAPSFPNFDGIMGFRNESNFDFYILQLSALNFEVRFRNSNNTFFNITSPTVQVNTWQHVAMVYNGSVLRFYHNGVKTDSVVATGAVTNPNVPFYIGRLPFQVNTNFDYSGLADEVSLWNRALTNEEIFCIYEGGIDTSKPGIVHYYPMNQGVAGGNNTTIVSLTDIVGGNNAVLNNFFGNGPTSNFVAGINQVSTIIDSICPGGSFTYNGVTFTQPGTYTYFAPNSEGCDTMLEVILYPYTVDTRVAQDSLTLTAMIQGASYQWVDCDNGFAHIFGETGRDLQVIANGAFAVIIDDGTCVDTSACITVNNVGLADNPSSTNWYLWPNPAGARVFLSKPLFGRKKIRVYNPQGQMLFEQYYDHNAGIEIGDLSPGLYLLEFVSSGEQRQVLRFVKH